jgi:type IV pilus assembly protein PilM
MTTSLMPRISRRMATSAVGLDISPRAIRAAQLEYGGNRWRIVRLSSWLRRESENGQATAEGFARRVKKSLRQADYKGRRTVVGISAPEVELHALEIPDHGELRDDSKFDEAATWELERVSGVSREDAMTSYWRVPPCKASRTTAMGVVARADDVAKASQFAQTIGLECESVDATACALSRLGAALRRSRDTTGQSIWSVMNVGHRTLNIVVNVDETPVLARSVGTGSQQWTSSIAKVLGLSDEAAESHKLDFGIDQNTDSTQEPVNREIASMVFNALRTDLNGIVNEVERSYEYVMRCFPNATVEGVLTVGGGADLRGLTGFLADKLGVEVRGLSDEVKLPGAAIMNSVSMKASLNPFGCAIGLAIEAEQPQ